MGGNAGLLRQPLLIHHHPHEADGLSDQKEKSHQELNIGKKSRDSTKTKSLSNGAINDGFK